MRQALTILLFALTLRCEQLPLRLFTEYHGLILNQVLRIRRDPSGFLWICTPEGLSLFDGARFINYAKADGLPDRQVYDLLAAKDGSYWQFWFGSKNRRSAVEFRHTETSPAEVEKKRRRRT